MDLKKKAALLAAAGAAAGILVAPAAYADICDPSATVCQGSEVSGPTSVPAASPSVIASDDAFPFGDDEWYLYPGAGVINRGGGGGHR
ncbi:MULTISPECIES: hypothetical protein [Mycolicibacterium]|uniref:Porin n=1 Tax=Mycolicibacterium mucogenicum TaxID=56689 RepID=A0A4R5W8N2_MYCMU|nr:MULTISPECIES: hypothetical protein [Mycolicibacterium]TDK85257.1 hypothetical protein EUA03_23270 [Mycolicibacterium mucogenicum]BCI78910.1 hypothetical protein MTY66_05350 [Mycolicibacterium sp. TY66]BCJ83429.1 hypothetical protein MTY81_48020 [Mycolicibacterium sp. TY81]